MGFVVAWRFLDVSGEEAGWSKRFADRGDAESWLASSWEELQARGVEAVELREGEAGPLLYRMSLADQ
jgi:hypothetical protein